MFEWNVRNHADYRQFVQSKTDFQWRSGLKAFLLVILVIFYGLVFKYDDEVNPFFVSSMLLFGVSAITKTIALNLRRIDLNRYMEAVISLDFASQITIMISVGLINFGRVWKGQCDDTKFATRWFCNPSDISNEIPFDSMLLLMIMPVSFSVIIRCSVQLAFLSWLIAVIFIVLCIGWAGATNSISSLVVYMPISLLVILDIQRQTVAYYLDAQQLKFLLSENERLADESYANELRHMIGNVAHDLKTVRISPYLCSSYFAHKN